jgi:hypothetical protein
MMCKAILAMFVAALVCASRAVAEPEQDAGDSLAQQAARTGVEGGWAGMIRDVDVCNILVEEWTVDTSSNKMIFQARLVSGAATPEPVEYEILSVEGNTITLSEGVVLSVDGDQMLNSVNGSRSEKHRCRVE